MRDVLARITWPAYWLAYPYLPSTRRQLRAWEAEEAAFAEDRCPPRVGRPTSRSEA